MPEITGIIKAKSQYGVKMTDDGEWWNWSKPEYRGQPFDTSVVAGDTVHVEYAEADSGKVYISTIGKVTGRAPKPLPAEFDADGEFVDELTDDGEAPPRLQPEPPDRLSDGPEWGYHHKDVLMFIESCAKGACGVYAAALAGGQIKEMPKGGEITSLARVLENHGTERFKALMEEL